MGRFDLELENWIRSTHYQRDISDDCEVLAREWELLYQENSELRTFINGKLLSVPIDFYDCLIIHELKQQPQVFYQASMIEDLLVKYKLGISDGWIAARMEGQIQKGFLKIVTDPTEKDHGLIYRRYLEKTDSFY